ncbi:hypothetical protein [Nocardia cyriacigeorgica]|uniref:hypothetical protein n=1 Tax=Nocardia cyriacigeorgica TaxID=135487 RepID=UPI0013D6778F|nr:hypothetical protein [Nocardia cyriacigeorgica]
MTALERRLGTTMPPGYAEFMATYGEGSICDALYAWGPDRILESLDAARESWGESWFWEHPDLVPADFAAAVPVGAGDLYVHVRFEPEYVTPYARVAAALLAVGSTRDGRWGAEPTA